MAKRASLPRLRRACAGVILLAGLAVTGPVTAPASAGDFNLAAFYNPIRPYDPSDPTWFDELQPLPIGPFGNPTWFQDCAPELFCPSEIIEIVLMVSTDRDPSQDPYGEGGVYGIDLVDPGTLTPVTADPNPSGIWSGNWDNPDDYLAILEYSEVLPPWEIVAPGPGVAPDGRYWLPGEIAQYPGGEDPTLGGNGQWVPLLLLAVSKDEIPCDEMTWISVAGQPSLFGQPDPLPHSYDWLNTAYGELIPPFVPYGRIDIICGDGPVCSLCVGDLVEDGLVNVTDFTVFAAAYGAKDGDANYNQCADFNLDGFINVTDFTVFADVFGEPCADQDPRPRCDNCHTVTDNINECHHWASDTNGAACSTTQCIQNDLDTASCDRHPKQTGTPECDTDNDTGGEVIQRIRQQQCPGGTVNWRVWKTLWYGCDDDCIRNRWHVTCETDTCNGTLIRGPFNRGTKKKCGC